MGCVAKALDEIKRTIPRDLLRIGFIDTLKDWRKAPASLDEQIMSLVIRPRVLSDADLIGGRHTVVPLDYVDGTYIDDYTIMYIIPMELTNNSPIISVKYVGYLPYAVSFSSFGAGVGTVGPSGITDLTGAGQRVGDAASNIPPVSEATVDLVGPNTVVVRNYRRITSAYHLVCMTGNDPNLNNISPRSWPAFAKLCQLAVKSHLYNSLVINIDKAYLSVGQELGSIKSLIDTMADSEEMYQTYLREVWSRVARMNDVPAYLRSLKSQVNPGI